MTDGYSSYSTLHSAHGFGGPGFEPAAICDACELEILDKGCGCDEQRELDRIDALCDEALRAGDDDLAELCLRFLEDADEAALPIIREALAARRAS